MSTSAEDVFARIEANLEAATIISAQAQEIGAELAKLSGTARSENDEVQVTVDHRGMMTSLRFTDAARAKPVDRLGALVIATTAAAIDDLRRQAQPIQARLIHDPASLIDNGDQLMQQLDDILKGRIGSVRAAGGENR